MLVVLRFQLDTYSAFEYKGGFVQTGLHEKLRENDIEIVFLTGLVLEDNIYFSALGATARSKCPCPMLQFVYKHRKGNMGRVTE